jgi:malate dehydrogenase
MSVARSLALATAASLRKTQLAIWGNHSSTQYPDFYNAKIEGKPATEVIKDESWLKEWRSGA